MDRSWRVRLYKEGDERSIFDLFKPEYGMSSRHRSHWSWEHKDNPFGSSLIVVAEHNGQIIGYGALVPVKIKVEKSVIMSSQAVELIVHPEFRRQGIFSEIQKLRLSKVVERGIRLIYAFPTELARRGELKYGFFDLCDLLVLVKCFDAYNIAIQKYPILRKGKFLLKVVLRPFDFVFRVFFKSRKVPIIEDLKVTEISSFDDRINNFWDSVSRDYKILLVRDKEYLNWRYFEKPDQDYKVFLAERNGRILGYIILGCKRVKDSKEGYIIDILTALNKTDVIRCLISQAIEHFVKEKVDVITCWTHKDNPLYKILRNNGFIHSRSRHPFTVRLNSPVLSEKFVKNSRNWYITMGDSDLI